MSRFALKSFKLLSSWLNHYLGTSNEFSRKEISPIIDGTLSSSIASTYSDGSNNHHAISDAGITNNIKKNPLLNVYLNQNAPPPLVLPAVDLLYSVQQQRNVSLYLPKNNPNEYTIGGVLSGNSGIDQHFIQTLSVSIQIPNTTTTNKCTVETLRKTT